MGKFTAGRVAVVLGAGKLAVARALLRAAGKAAVRRAAEARARARWDMLVVQRAALDAFVEGL
jgi:hypothetical protein